MTTRMSTRITRRAAGPAMARAASAACLAALMTAPLTASHAFAQDATPIKIGFMASFSGPAGALAQDQYDGFMLAVEQRQGKLGNAPVQILKEDDQFKPEVGTQAVEKLITKENVPIITGISATNVMMAIAKPVTDRKVFLISTNSGPSPLAGAGCSPYQYVVSWQADESAEVVGKYATDKGYKRVVVLAPNYQAGKDVAEGFKRYYKGQIVDEFYTPLTQLDFASEISQVSEKKPDAVFAFFPGSLGIAFVRQYQQAGLFKSIPMLSAFILDGTTLPALKDSALGAVSGAFWGPDLDNPANRSFVEAFEKKYSRIPSNFAAQGYDGALLIDSAIAKVKGNMADKAAFAAALKAADFKSVRGDFKFNVNNFPIMDMHVFEVAKDAGGRVSLKRTATPLKGHSDSYAGQCRMG